ncbi:MAG: peptidoglycan DD-metalloendopeptidase family protein, partial [Ignavibacteria bacterium]|nr:peptidoglycan DD-metalloendopeptidase family protein [Ignavibacteria bacterium]
MNKLLWSISILIFLLVCIVNAQTSQTSFVAGHGKLIKQSALTPCIPSSFYSEFQNRITKGSSINTKYPMFSWPMEKPLHDGLILVNYVDDDNSSAIVDYNGLPHSYDGHNGTDFTLYSFRAMDEGIKNIAAADGIVTETFYSRGDRNYEPPYPDNGNYVIIEHADGTFGWYWHFRKNSITVEPGEQVQKGQMLGYAGSSGFSSDAHLHFEVGEYISSNWVKRDPWNGSFNTLPSLWENQEPYVGLENLRVYDAGTTTAAAVGGDVTNIPAYYFKEGFRQPAVIGAVEPSLVTWLLVQGQQGDLLNIEILRPNGTIWGNVNYSLPVKWQYGWVYWFWNFAGTVSPADIGTWSLVAKSNGSVLNDFEFEVNTNTDFKPRFWPVSGRSIRINGTEQFDTLRVSELGDGVTFSLENAPGFVTLVSDSIVRVDIVSNQPYRSLNFEAIAVDGAGRKGEFHYHIVDPSKPPNPTTGIENEITDMTPEDYILEQNFPNPFNPSTKITYVMPQAGFVTLKIYDMLGNEVKTLVNEIKSGGSHSVTFEGGKLTSGIYMYRLQA